MQLRLRIIVHLNAGPLALGRLLPLSPQAEATVASKDEWLTKF